MLLNIVVEVLTSPIRQEKEFLEGINIDKEEVKLSSCTCDMMICIENPKESIKKLLNLISEFSENIRDKY